LPPKPAISPLGRALGEVLDDAHVPAEVRKRLRAWLQRAERQRARNTLSAWARDWRAFANFCTQQQARALPAEPLSVSLFIYENLKAGRRRETVRDVVRSVGRVHRAAGAADPTADPAVQPALAETKLAPPTRRRLPPPRMSTGCALRWQDIERFLALPPRRPRDYRDRALIAVGYDTLCQPQELARMNLSEVRRRSARGAALHFPHAADTPGPLLEPTLQLIDEWLQVAKLHSGPLFRRLSKGGRVMGALSAVAINAIVKAAGARSGLSKEECRRLSGKSLRLGAALDLRANNVPDHEIAQAGRWQRLPVLPADERVVPTEHCMARVARAQGRA
jgi:integrase